MTKLSVNINKVALLRNSRGRDYPSVSDFAARCLDLGAAGITLHPRPDERHARYADIGVLKEICDRKGAELNVEGYPTEDFLSAVLAARPTQCTLVPDAPSQLTSDHGWKIGINEKLLRQAVGQLVERGIRVSLFVDFDSNEIEAAEKIGAHRVELYTEPYASAYETSERETLLAGFRSAAFRAQSAGLGVNAGHDLNLRNLNAFLMIPGILEVSIGHALVAECLEEGLPNVMARYVQIVGH